MNVEDRPYNQPCWEMGRRKPDWRMRSPSVEGGDTTTPSERGPLGPGGAVEAEVPHFEAGVPFGGGRPKAPSNWSVRRGMSGSDLSRLGSQEGWPLNLRVPGA